MATYPASTSSRTDVAAAIALATNAGDIVTVPAGTSTWASTITVTQSISILGTGGVIPTDPDNNTTVINTSSVIAFTVTPGADASLTRIAGFSFVASDTTTSAIKVNGKNNAGSGTTILNMRLDHNKFTNGSRMIELNGWAYPCVDHNHFVNCNIGVGINGDENAAWGRSIVAGTINAAFVETNIFTVNNSALSTPNQQVYSQTGARPVVRYNTFDASAYTSGVVSWLDHHGNQDYFTTATGSVFRGCPLAEYYNNTYNSFAEDYRPRYFRSGSTLVHDETITNTTTSGSHTDTYIFTEQEGWDSAFFSPLRTVWPACDQVTNTFLWNITYNGAAVTDISDSGHASDAATFIQKDRDYFMHAPAASGGSSSWSGYLGGSSTSPTGASASTMSFTGSGANAFYPYTPFTYPHPLAGTASTNASSLLGKVLMAGKCQMF